MNFTISRNEFLKGLQQIQGIVDVRGAQPILANVLIEAEKGGIAIKATNLELGFLGSYEADVKKKGCAVLNAKRLYDIVRELPADDVKLKEEENLWVTIECMATRFRLPGADVSAFPGTPEVSLENAVEFDASQLKELIKYTHFAISTEVIRNAISGSLLEIKKNSVNMVATDGHRLCLKTVHANTGISEDRSAIIPRKALNELSKMLEVGGKVLCAIQNNSIVFAIGNMTLISRLIEGQFPDYTMVIPKDNTLKIRINSDSLHTGLRRVSLLANERSRLVKFDISSSELVLSTDNYEIGEAREAIQADYKGNDIHIAFNARYIMDVLNVVETEQVSLELKDTSSAGLLIPFDPASKKKQESGDYTCVIMPMRTQQDF